MFKYILVPATGAETDAAVFATALAVARLSAGHLAFLHVRSDARENLLAMTSSADMGGGGGDYYRVIETLEQIEAESRAKAIQAFRELCDKEQLTIPGDPSLCRPSADWTEATGQKVLLMAEYGRAADLIVLGRASDGTVTERDVFEASLLQTGRPVLIAPPSAPSQLVDTVVIAWKDKAEAARAVAAARPFIEAADRVIIFTVEEGVELGERSSDRLRNALSWHNPNTSVQRLSPDGRAPVEVLLDAARAVKADLLVMGGYSHSRVREVIFGGFTRHVLNRADLPILMAH
ncbi:MAG TPA: hypothetical protein DDZ81_01215 [Acetobacteraceae bacterium]|jgi:nucleotide-binding universal stress UspA family protein|nr:hypothetical protein [Acetobacteraceae bacterium]